MITVVLLLSVIGILIWYLFKREGYSEYPGNQLPYNPSSDPFKYSGFGDVGYIGPDPVDIRIIVVKNYLSQLRSNVQFIRVDNISTTGNKSDCKFVFTDDSVTPYGYQVSAVLDTSKIVPVILTFNIFAAPIDITNGLASIKFTQGLIQKPSTEKLIAGAVQKAILDRDGLDVKFVSTQSLNNNGNVFAATMTFLDVSDFPVGIQVRATVDISSCPPNVLNLAYSEGAVPSNNAVGPINTAIVYDGITPFKGDKSDPYFPFVTYDSIQKAAAPDLISLKSYKFQLSQGGL